MSGGNERFHTQFRGTVSALAGHKSLLYGQHSCQLSNDLIFINDVNQFYYNITLA